MFLTRALLLLPAVLVAVAVAGCDTGDDGAPTTQLRDVAAFTRLANSTSVDVRLRAGERQRVRVLAGDKVIDDVGTGVRDGTLHITFDHDGPGPGDVVIEASVPELTAIETSGSGDIAVDGIDAEAFELRSDGSGDTAVEGAVGRLAVILDGSGHADLAGLVARDARVVVGGSGGVDVRADERLDVDIDGSGDVHYSGEPQLTQHIDGSGDLRHGS